METKNLCKDINGTFHRKLNNLSLLTFLQDRQQVIQLGTLDLKQVLHEESSFLLTPANLQRLSVGPNVEEVDHLYRKGTKRKR